KQVGGVAGSADVVQGALQPVLSSSVVTPKVGPTAERADELVIGRLGWKKRGGHEQNEDVSGDLRTIKYSDHGHSIREPQGAHSGFRDGGRSPVQRGAAGTCLGRCATDAVQ